MDLKEASSILQISKEEIASIQRYLGFMHTNINILSDFSPKTYLTLKNTAWAIDESPEKIAKNIQDFVNLYTAMYKESKYSHVGSMLVRGTSNARMRSMGEGATQFLSTSTDEGIAKTFTKYGDGAIAHIHVGDDVPFLDPTPYRSENVRDEHEFILAPFCKAKVERNGTFNGYTYYQVTMQKGELQQKEPEELSTLYDEVMSGFSQNIQDIKELDQLETRLGSLDRFYLLAQGDIEEQAYIREEKQKVQDEYDKLVQTPQNASNLEATLLKTYNDFVHTDEKAKGLAKQLGIEYTRTIKSTNARQLVEQIQANLQETVSRINGVKLDENASIEEAQKIASEVLERVDGVSYAVEVAQSLPELVDLNKKQVEAEIKRRVYDRVQTVIQQARVQKYTAEKESIQGENIGLLGKLFGKEQLREKKLENLDLKIELAQRNVLPENDEYSIRQMLVDMHICASTELGGEFTPEMQELYQAIMNTYGEKNKDILSERNIRRLVSQRQAANQTTAELPVVRGNRPRIFGKTKAQANMVELENQGLKQKLLRLRTTNSLRTGRVQQSQEPDAISLLEQRLKGIAVNTQERDRQVDLETTFDMWK